MNLAEKLRALRAQEGLRRGLWRSLTQREVVTALRQELGLSLSQAYLSQLEGGKRIHLTNASREALARFYRVHPGYLVNDLADVSPPSHPFPSLRESLREALAPHSQRATQPTQFTPLSHLPVQAQTATLKPQHPQTHNGWFGWLETGAPVDGLEAMGLLCRLPQHGPDSPNAAATVQQTTDSDVPNDALASASCLLGAPRDRPKQRRVLILMEALLRLPDDRLRLFEEALGLVPPTPASGEEGGEQAGVIAQQPTPVARRSAEEHED